MRSMLSMKTMFRSPARMILTIVLLGLASFAFFVQVGGYAVTRRELNNAALEYRAVGFAETTPPSIQLVKAPFYIYADPRISGSYTDVAKELHYDAPLPIGNGIYSLDKARYLHLINQ
ncbi:MAG: hypothetical protein FWG28_07945 [Clostridiales bacterium]|nr:hypothetical protein [Clostridiales bacterium]